MGIISSQNSKEICAEILDENDLLTSIDSFNRKIVRTSKVPKDLRLYEQAKRTTSHRTSIWEVLSQPNYEIMSEKVILAEISKENSKYNNLSIYASISSSVSNVFMEQLDEESQQARDFHRQFSLIMDEKLNSSKALDYFQNMRPSSKFSEMAFMKYRPSSLSEIVNNETIAADYSDINKIVTPEEAEKFHFDLSLNRSKDKEDKVVVKSGSGIKKKHVEFKDGHLKPTGSRLSSEIEVSSKRLKPASSKNVQMIQLDSNKNIVVARPEMISSPNIVQTHFKKTNLESISEKASILQSRVELRKVSSNINIPDRSSIKKSSFKQRKLSKIRVNFEESQSQQIPKNIKYVITLDLKDLITPIKETANKEKKEESNRKLIRFSKKTSQKLSKDEEVGPIDGTSKGFFMLNKLKKENISNADESDMSSIIQHNYKSYYKVNSRKENSNLPFGHSNLPKTTTNKKHMSIKSFEVDISSLKAQTDTFTTLGTSRTSLQETFKSNLLTLEKFKKDNKFLFA